MRVNKSNTIPLQIKLIYKSFIQNISKAEKESYQIHFRRLKLDEILIAKSHLENS